MRLVELLSLFTSNEHLRVREEVLWWLFRRDEVRGACSSAFEILAMSEAICGS